VSDGNEYELDIIVTVRMVRVVPVSLDQVVLLGKFDVGLAGRIISEQWRTE
jgi:hypothetical protein